MRSMILGVLNHHNITDNMSDHNFTDNNSLLYSNNFRCSHKERDNVNVYNQIDNNLLATVFFIADLHDFHDSQRFTENQRQTVQPAGVHERQIPVQLPKRGTLIGGLIWKSLIQARHEHAIRGSSLRISSLNRVPLSLSAAQPRKGLLSHQDRVFQEQIVETRAGGYRRNGDFSLVKVLISASAKYAVLPTTLNLDFTAIRHATSILLITILKRNYGFVLINLKKSNCKPSFA